MRLDLLMTVLGLLLVLAMILTLIYGREYSRHGYGKSAPTPGAHQREATIILAFDVSAPLYRSQHT